MRLSEMAVDLEKQEEGDWFDHPLLPGVRVRVRSIHSEAYKRRNRKLVNGIPPSVLRKRGENAEIFEAIMLRLLHEIVLVDWEGIQDENGKEIPFTREMAAEIIRDAKYRKFAAGIQECANLAGDRDAEFLEEDAGNLSSGSDASSVGQP